jgi:hypothetical protein
MRFWRAEIFGPFRLAAGGGGGGSSFFAAGFFFFFFDLLLLDMARLEFTSLQYPLAHLLLRRLYPLPL